MTNPAAKDERFLAVAGDFMWMREVAALLRARLGEKAKCVPTGGLPDWLVRIAALADPSVGQIIPELNKFRPCSNEKARTLLGWAPRSNEDAIMATAESLIRLGLVKA
jgi:nucleoside-diphosphate-sugar epimerase